MIACQCALARLVTLEVDWPLWRDSYSSVSPTYVERDRLNGNAKLITTSDSKMEIFHGFLNLQMENIPVKCKLCI